MREIKFRARDKNAHTLIGPEFIEMLLDGKEIAYQDEPIQSIKHNGLTGEPEVVKEEQPYYRWKGNPFKKDSFVLMQYTGLKTVDGTEVYEGDILEGYGNPSQVVYEPNIGYGTRLPDGTWNGMLHVWSYHVHTHNIGNIYENPELLEGK